MAGPVAHVLQVLQAAPRFHKPDLQWLQPRELVVSITTAVKISSFFMIGSPLWERAGSFERILSIASRIEQRTLHHARRCANATDDFLPPHHAMCVEKVLHFTQAQICPFREASAVIEIRPSGMSRVTGRTLIARRFALMLSTFVATHVIATMCAADDAQQIRPADQIWLVNSRHLPYGNAACDENITFEFQQYADACQWNSKDKEAFHATQHQCEQTLIYVHGNRIGPCDVQQRGLQVYRALIDQADEQQSLRFVIFSWPSTRIRGVLRDARLKAARSDPAAYYLAHLLQRIDPEVKVSLTGYSLGARVITGGLHILAGGELDGLELGEREQGEPVHPGRKPMCVVLMTAALNDYWLEPDAYHSRTLSQVESLLLLNNHCDKAMKRYGAIERCGSPWALGYRGVASYSALGTEAEKIQQYDVCCDIGKSHDFMLYLYNPKLMSMVWKSLNCDQLVEP